MDKKYYAKYMWLKDEDYAQNCKDILVDLYEKYFKTSDTKEKEELFKQLEIYLSVVCDIIAYRYLVKHYSHLFYRLCITVEEYINYKVKRLLVTIKSKKEHIDDILGYVYMSFMLSSPRLIYDYAEKIGHCRLVKEVLPYYQVSRNKFFNNVKTNDSVEHIIYNVDNLYLNDSENDQSIRSNIDKYSYSKWKTEYRLENNDDSDFDALISIVKSMSKDYSESSINYLLDIFNNWKTKVENDYLSVKLENKFGNSYSLIDYIKYNYENNKTNLTKDVYLDVLKILNTLLKENN